MSIDELGRFKLTSAQKTRLKGIAEVIGGDGGTEIEFLATSYGYRGQFEISIRYRRPNGSIGHQTVLRATGLVGRPLANAALAAVEREWGVSYTEEVAAAAKKRADDLRELRKLQKERDRDVRRQVVREMLLRHNITNQQLLLELTDKQLDAFDRQMANYSRNRSMDEGVDE